MKFFTVLFRPFFGVATFLLLLHLGAVTVQGAVGVGIVPAGAAPGYVRLGTPQISVSGQRIVTSLASYRSFPENDASYGAALQVFDIGAGPILQPTSVIYVSNVFAGKPVLLGRSNWCAVVVSGGGIASPSALRVYDLRQPVAQVAGQVLLTGSFVDLSLEDSLLAVAHAPAGGTIAVSLFDVSNPAQLVFRSGFRTRTNATGVRVIGSRLFALGATLEIYDIADPAHPGLLGQFNPTLPARAMAATGNAAYLAIGTGIQVVNLSNPAAPANVRLLEVGCVELRVRNGQLYSLDGGARITRWSLTNPLTPTVVDEVLVDFRSPQVAGIADDHIGFVDDLGGIHAAEIRPDGGVVSLGRVAEVDLNSSSSQIVVAGNRVFVDESSQPATHIRIFDVSVPGQPREFKLANPQKGFDGGTPGFAVDQAGQLVAYQSFTDVSLYDVSDPRTPVKRSVLAETFGYPPAAFGFLSNRLVSLIGTNLSVHDIRQPANPVLLGRLPVQDSAAVARLGVAGNIVALGREWPARSVVFFDVTNPEQIERLATIAIPDSISAVTIRDGYAFVGAMGDGFRIFDIRDVRNPQELAHVTFPPPAYDRVFSVAADGNRLYVALQHAGLLVYDITDRGHPQLIGRRKVLGTARGVTAGPGGAYVACTEAGFQIFQLRELRSTTPKWIESAGSPALQIDLPLADLRDNSVVVTAETRESVAAGAWAPIPAPWRVENSEFLRIQTPPEDAHRWFRFQVDFP